MISKIGANLTFKGSMIVPSVSKIVIAGGKDYSRCTANVKIKSNEISSITNSIYRGYTEIGKPNGETIYVPNNKATNQDIILAYIATKDPNKDICVECGRY